MSEIKLVHYDEILDWPEKKPSAVYQLWYGYYGMFEIWESKRLFFRGECITSFELAAYLYRWLIAQRDAQTSFDCFLEGMAEDYPLFSIRYDDMTYRLDSFDAEFQSTSEYSIRELASPVCDFIRSVQAKVHNLYGIDILQHIPGPTVGYTGGLVKADTLIPIESPFLD